MPRVAADHVQHANALSIPWITYDVVCSLAQCDYPSTPDYERDLVKSKGKLLSTVCIVLSSQYA